MKRDLKINEDEWSFLIDFLKKGNRLLLDRRSGLIKIYWNFSPKIIRGINKIFISDMFHILFVFFFEGIIFPLLDKNDEELTDKI